MPRKSTHSSTLARPSRDATRARAARARDASKPETDAQPAHVPSREASAVRGFWSGNLSFGLVSIPVNLITAQRTTRVAARMLGPDGAPLKRRYFCSKHDDALDAADIVRGFEVEKERFVVVTDDELRALAPKLSQEIDLTRFVPLADIDPIHFEHGYYLVPDKRAGKAYRLLARVMEARSRAGIATFVMRGKQYLVAIVATGGLLRALTLRFADELRSHDDVAVEIPDTVAESVVDALERDIDALCTDALAPHEFEDTYTQRLLALIERKRAAGHDVISAPLTHDEESTGAKIVDLLQYLKDSIASSAADAPRGRRRPRAAAGDDAAKSPAGRRRRARPAER